MKLISVALVLTFVIVALNPSARNRIHAEESRSLPADKFVNPIGEGADPWLIRDPNEPRYLWCMSEGNRAIAVHTSRSPISMGTKHIVWRAPESGPVSKQVWAPELHFLDNRWHIYFAASDGENANHLAYVLRSTTRDPLGDYELHGPFATGEGEDGRSPNLWAIDMTVLDHHGKCYALWSGWDEPESDRQFLYIAPMRSPTELADRRVRLCDNDDYLWERVEPDASKRGLNEGPQVFQSNGQTSVVYSCGASWLPTYKLGLLELVGDDPMDPRSWRKRPEPVFVGSESVYGLGHSCFVRSLDDQQWWHIFHAKRDRRPGWRRVVFSQPMHVDDQGLPVFGTPVAPMQELQRPSGQPTTSNETISIGSFEYFGHHQFIDADDGSIELGVIPEAPINDYRCGEKVVFNGSVDRDCKAEVTIDFHGDGQARDAGILFRTTAASIGYDAQRGYFAGLIPRTNLVILGKTDGTTWTEIARATTKIDAAENQRLTIQTIGEIIRIWHNGVEKIEHSDATYDRGSIGLRVVDTHATFTQLRVTPATVKN